MAPSALATNLMETESECFQSNIGFEYDRTPLKTPKTYIEEHDVSVRQVGLKGCAVVEEIGSVGCDRAALVARAVGRDRRLPRQTTRDTRHGQYKHII